MLLNQYIRERANVGGGYEVLDTPFRQHPLAVCHSSGSRPMTGETGKETGKDILVLRWHGCGPFPFLIGHDGEQNG
jgi:hypothetical protein